MLRSQSPPPRSSRCLVPDTAIKYNLTPTLPPRRAVDPEMQPTVTAIENLLPYTFADPTLLEEAFTHSSHPRRESYQRLEFVGDAALTLVFSNYLYLANPTLGPGPLSALRAANISTEKLARVAVRLGLYNHLRRNSPILDNNVEEFSRQVLKEQREAPFGGTATKAPKVLADIFEGLAAAVYVDSGFNLELVWKIFRKHLEPIITLENLEEQPITALYMLCQKNGLGLDIRTCRKRNMTITSVFVDGKLTGTDISEQKTISKLNAARDALKNLSAQLLVEPSSRVVGEKDGSKQKLNDICTKNRWSTPIYRVEKEQGPAHDKRFICSVALETPSEQYVTVGAEKPKVRDAENSAAAEMLSGIKSTNIH